MVVYYLQLVRPPFSSSPSPPSPPTTPSPTDRLLLQACLNQLLARPGRVDTVTCAAHHAADDLDDRPDPADRPPMPRPTPETLATSSNGGNASDASYAQ